MGFTSCRRADRPGRRAFVSALLAFALCAPLSVLPGCGDAADEPELTLELTLSPDPPSVGETSLRLAVKTPDGTAVEGAEVRVEATMAHAGMVPEFVTCTELEPGLYGGDFELTMGGSWLMIVDVVLADGRSSQQVLAVPRVAARRDE